MNTSNVKIEKIPSVKCGNCGSCKVRTVERSIKAVVNDSFDRFGYYCKSCSHYTTKKGVRFVKRVNGSASISVRFFDRDLTLEKSSFKKDKYNNW